MKMLIAYDGSSCSDALLDDLCLAGLPKTGEAVVVSVSEMWLPPPDSDEDETDQYLEEFVKRHREKAENALKAAEELSERARGRLQRILPKWKIKPEATYGSPAWEILSRATDLGSDLIVVGSHGHSAIGRFFLGSISQKVLTEAKCSVRVARGRIEVDPGPVRIMIAFDCSNGAKAAVDAVATRQWPEGSEVRLVAVTDPVTPSLIGQFIPPVAHAVDDINEAEYQWIEKQAAAELARLESAGARTSLNMVSGNAKHVLVDEAEGWNADCIFMGAHAYSGRIEKMLLGSTSAAVAARAHCSVEVVRK